MADLTVVTMQQCLSWKGIDTKINGYEQSGVGTKWAFCTCKAYKYSKNTNKTCKHLKEAEKELCLWHEQFDGSPEKDGVCPNCGRKTEYVRVGV